MERFDREIFAKLSPVSCDLIEGDRFAAEPAMEIDDFLQFSFVDGVHLSDDLLDMTETSVRGGWDPDLAEHTLMWVAKHRERNSLLSNV
ncbi:hypothetical protein [Trueperella pyogenes]|uniref:hypothetical protein n=1 Tax=Trueperella pyogenes TaxID=1661 RepID=UPI000F88FB42|nr:hypothetical protein [Trueperella pyogenes]MBB3025718.1 hypothetical protein [Trueperella pyogenes]MCI7689783.1 hypothetical protein [Trueperella pyogenes]QIU87242.1 hypothetical protein HEP79_08435 [Trueperella pyogenes]WHU57732.1 hypothetical protein QEV10_03295 [Trueperella pyogenes]